MGMTSRTQMLALLLLGLISLIAISLIILSMTLHTDLLHLFSSFLRFGPNAMYPH